MASVNSWRDQLHPLQRTHHQLATEDTFDVCGVAVQLMKLCSSTATGVHLRLLS